MLFPGLTLSGQYVPVGSQIEPTSTTISLQLPEFYSSDSENRIQVDDVTQLDIPHPPIEFSRFAFVINKDEHDNGVFSQVGSTIDQIQETLGVTLKGAVGSIVTLGLQNSEIPVEFSALLVNPVTKKSWIITELEPVDIKLTEPVVRFDLYIGTTSELLERQQDLLPTEIELMQNYPNPFNPVTNIRFALPQEQHVQLEVFDLLGRRVQTLVNGVIPAGWHVSQFNAMNYASGVYIYRLVVDGTVKVQKMTVIK